MQVRTRNAQQDLQQITMLDEGAADQAPSEDRRNIVVSHGIHRGRFPIGGMSVAAARRILAPLINIDAEAIAVINGTPVTEDTIVNDQVTMLSFVKPSSIRG